VAATYNIWNSMFGWDVRKLHIAEILLENLPDFVAMQEAARP
jgi:hypothetical protein